MDGENIGNITHEAFRASDHPEAAQRGMSQDAKQRLNVNAESARKLTGAQMDSILSGQHQAELRRAATNFRPTATDQKGADQQLLAHLRQQGAGMTTGTDRSFHEFTSEQQDHLLRERVLKQLDM
jgi:hypothetical protein